jgi:prepilin peptidase CpaA
VLSSGSGIVAVAGPLFFLLFALLAAAFDLNTRRIPNWLSASCLLAGLVLNPSLSQALQAMLLATALYLTFWYLGLVGGGDAKLMIALAAHLTPIAWLTVFVFTALVGGVIALTLLLSRGLLRESLRRVIALLKTLLRSARPHPTINISSSSAQTLPHAVSIAIGAVLYLLSQGGV